MPEMISKEEMLIRTTMRKAKEVIQEAKHLGTIENKEDVNGETVKVTRPKKNPKEEKVKNPVSTDDINSGYGLAGSDSEWKAILQKNYVPSFYQQSQDAQAMHEAQSIDEKADEARGDARRHRRHQNEFPLGLGRFDLLTGGAKTKEQAARQEAKDLNRQASKLRHHTDTEGASGYDHEVELQERDEQFDQGGHQDSFSTFPPTDANESSRAGVNRSLSSMRRKNAPEAMEGFQPDWQKNET